MSTFVFCFGKKKSCRKKFKHGRSIDVFFFGKQNLIYLIESPREEFPLTLLRRVWVFCSKMFHVLDTPTDVVDQYPRHAPLDGVDTMGR